MARAKKAPAPSTMAEAVPLRPLADVVVRDIAEIRESKTNPRQISDRAVEVVALSLKRFGWRQPLVVDSDGVLVVGHTRIRAARSLGATHAPVVVADDLTAAEIDAYRIADNRTHDFTRWDLPELATQLDALAEEFSDVLALADWEAVVGELESAQQDAEASTLDLPAEVEDALDGGFTLTVHFHSKDDALAAESTIIELPGAFDVRHNR